MASQHQIDLDELLEGQWMEKSRQRARLRLVDSLESKEGESLWAEIFLPKKDD